MTEQERSERLAELQVDYPAASPAIIERLLADGKVR